jgi:phosphoglycolate phosphatase-like HAD superfamily hydrolase
VQAAVLDYTLYNWKTGRLYVDVPEILERISQDRHSLMAITTHNLNPMPVLERTGIAKYFSCVASGRLSKDQLVCEVVKKLNIDMRRTRIHFIDDQLANLAHVSAVFPEVNIVWASDGLELDDLTLAGT